MGDPSALGVSGGRPLVLVLSFGLLLVAVAAFACGGGDTPTPGPLDRGLATITLTTPAFGQGQAIPVEYTCDGQDSSPALEWGAVPDGTESLALIMDDPDAPGGIFTHWVVYDMKADRTGILAGATEERDLTDGGFQGINSFNRIGYGGPCPPVGPDHTYRFFIFAIDRRLNLEAGASATEVLAALRGYVLGSGQLEATYGR